MLVAGLQACFQQPAAGLLAARVGVVLLPTRGRVFAAAAAAGSGQQAELAVATLFTVAPGTGEGTAAAVAVVAVAIACTQAPVTALTEQIVDIQRAEVGTAGQRTRTITTGDRTALHVHAGQQERIDIGERTTRAMPGIVAKCLGDTVDHGVDPASTGHAADVDLQARLAARMEAVGARHRAQQAVAFLAFGHRHALAADRGRKAIAGGRYILAGAGTRCLAVCGSTLHPQRAGAAAAIGAFGRRRFQGGTTRIHEARAQAAACQQARQGLRIVEVTAQRRRRMTWGQRRADHQIDTGQPAVGVQRGRQWLGGQIVASSGGLRVGAVWQQGNGAGAGQRQGEDKGAGAQHRGLQGLTQSVVILGRRSRRPDVRVHHAVPCVAAATPVRRRRGAARAPATEWPTGRGCWLRRRHCQAG